MMIEPQDNKSITSEAESLCNEMEQFFMQKNGYRMALYELKKALCQSFCAGMNKFAHWKDGVELVGTCGNKYREQEEIVYEDNQLRAPGTVQGEYPISEQLKDTQ